MHASESLFDVSAGLPRSLQDPAGQLQVSSGLVQVCAGLPMSLQVSPDLSQVFEDHCRPTQVFASLFRSPQAGLFLLKSIQACSRSLQVSPGFSRLVLGICRYLQECSRSLQVSAGLVQAFQRLCRPCSGLCRRAQVSAGVCRPAPGLCRSLQVSSGLL